MKCLELLDEQIETLNQMMATALKKYEDTVTRLAQVPGLGVDSAQQIIAEVGVDAESFPSAGEFASWIGVCPGEGESAEVNQSTRSPKGNRFMRRILDQAAQAAVKKNGCHFQNVFRRLVPKIEYKGAVWAVAHRIARVVWLILHKGITYIEQGVELNPKAKKLRANKLIKALKKLGYGVTISPINPQLASQPEG